MTRAGDPTLHRSRILAGLMLTMGLAAMDSTIVATAVPAIVGDLSGFALFPWVFSVYVLVTAVCVPIYGKLADLYGRRPMLVVGTSIFLVGSMCCGIAWSMPALIGFRALQGVGAGAIQSMTQTVVGDIYTIEERGRIAGWMSSVWGFSAVVGPAVGGLLSEYATWRWIFFINIPVGLGAMVLVIRYLREDVVRRPHRIDVVGAALLVAGAGLVVLGLLSGGIQWPWVSWQSLVAIGGGICSLVLFGLQERRAPEPILPAWVMGTRLLTGANLGSMCVGLTVIGLTTYIPMFAQGALGTGAVTAGFVLAVMSIGWPIASSQSAKLYLRIGFRDTALLGVVAMFAATAIFLTVGVGDSPLHAAAGSVVMGVGLGLLSTPLLVGVQSVVGWGRRGVVTGAQMFTRTLGSALGAAIFGGIANSTLSSWLQDAPTRIADQLPGSINGAAKLLSNGGGADPQVVAYVRDGLFEAVHWVFWGIGVVAVLALVVLLLTPRRFKPLDEEME